MWIFWALISAISAATRRTNEKKLTQHINNFAISFACQLLSLPIIGLFVGLRGEWLNPLHLGAAFWLPTIIVCIGFYPLNSVLYLGAMKHGELSNVLPLQSLTPVFAILPAWLALREIPILIASIGVALIVLGVYALGLKGRRLHHPLQPFREDRSSLLMLLTVVLVTVTVILDKIAIEASNGSFYSLVSTVGAVIVLYTTMRLRGIQEWSQLRGSLANLTITGTLQGATYVTYSLAMSLGPVAYVTAIRSSNIVMSALVGIVLLKERLTTAKIVSLCLILVGGTILAIGS